MQSVTWVSNSTRAVALGPQVDSYNGPLSSVYWLLNIPLNVHPIVSCTPHAAWIKIVMFVVDDLEDKDQLRQIQKNQAACKWEL